MDENKIAEDTRIYLKNEDGTVTLGNASLHHYNTFDGMISFRSFIWMEFCCRQHLLEECEEKDIIFLDKLLYGSFGFIAEWPEQTQDYKIKLYEKNYVVSVKWNGLHDSELLPYSSNHGWCSFL